MTVEKSNAIYNVEVEVNGSFAIDFNQFNIQDK